MMGALRSCFARTQTWLQAGKYVNALASELASRNGWSGLPAVLMVLARIFFEISRRLSGYAGYGVINDPVRMAAHHARRLSAS